MLGLVLAALLLPGSAMALDLVETPMLEPLVASGELPPVAERVPGSPLIVDLAAEGKEPGQPGGEITWLAGRARDIRIQNVYSYARLIGYTTDFQFVPDILEAFEVEEGRIFTFHLRPGHKWSDGEPFTTEDFRYQFFDVETNIEIKPFGPDSRLVVDGELPNVEIVDEVTIRYSWSKPNPQLLPALAAPAPMYLYAPSHYLRQFHAAYADAAILEQAVATSQEQNWAGLHIVMSNLYASTNPDLPDLQPWINTTAPPSDRFVFERNPYFHRIDAAGHQLPYIDRVIVNISDSSLIPAKTGAGESDLQARHIRFDNYTFLKQSEERNSYRVNLWPTALGADVALFPNLNVNDPVWKELNRDVRFRRALSLAIDRDEINQVIYYGLARPSNNTALPESPLFDEERSIAWTQFDLDQANALMDEIGLTERDGRGIRLLPDGRPLEITIESTGERTEEIDILQLVADTWKQIGVALYTNVSQRDVYRTRIFSGDAMMSIWQGYDNGLLTADSVPHELAPIDQNWVQYPKWGQFVQTGGTAGEAPDMPFGQELMQLYDQWRITTDPAERQQIIGRMLDIHVENMTSIGIVQGVMQPVVVANRLHNVPTEGIYSWDPGAHFGMYHPDTFWISP
jgi:peptide/nickel transport system substrate-binding protein